MKKELEAIVNDVIEFNSQILNENNIDSIIGTIVEVYNASSTKLLPSSELTPLYYALKSYRSNVTEGNTTTLGEFTQIIQGDTENIVGQTQDNLLEIENLWKAYTLVYEMPINEKTMLSCHRILGTNIIKNNLMLSRGKYKRVDNFVSFTNSEQRYIKRFRKSTEVKQDIRKLIKLLEEFTPQSEAEVFAKYLIIHTELISIHPFEDGNGRIARLMSEKYLEEEGYQPYSPFSDSSKKEYQNAMGVFSVISTSSLAKAYQYLASYILSVYLENTSNFNRSYQRFEKILEK